MVGHSPLWKIIGTNAFGAVARADKDSSHIAGLVNLGLDFGLLNFGNQHFHRLVFVGVLRAFLLALGNHACGNMRDSHRRIGGINVLTARPT